MFEQLANSESEEDEESLTRGLDLMSTAKIGETLRRSARSCAEEFHLLSLGAATHERLLTLRHCLDSQHAAQEILRMPGRSPEKLGAKKALLRFEKEWKQTMKDLEESDFLCLAPVDSPSDVTFEDKVLRQMDSAGPWAEAFREWVGEVNLLTTEEFVERVTVLAVESGQANLNQFLQSLSMELSWTRVEARMRSMSGMQDYLAEGDHLSPWQLFMAQERNFFVLGHQPLTGSPSGPELASFVSKISDGKFDSKELAAFRFLRELISKCLGGDKSLMFKAAYSITPAVQLLNRSDRDLALMLKSIVDAGQQSECFNSVLGKAILQEALGRTLLVRVLHCSVDLAFVVLLSLIGRKVQTQEHASVELLVSFSFLGLWVAVACSCKVTVGILLFVDCNGGFWSLLAGAMKQLTLWNALLTTADVWSVFVSIRFLIFYFCSSLTGFEFFMNHPVMISMLCLIRWTLLALDFFEIEQIGRRVVPIVHAVSRPASVYFLFFLALVLAGSFQAYSVFPIEDNLGGTNVVLNTFLKVFRLEVLGDFDLSELEGIPDKLKAKDKNGTIAGAVDADPDDWSDKYHRGVRFEFMALSLAVTVIMMNVYIGLLSSLYDKATLKKNQLYSHYLASCCFRHLCLKRLINCRWDAGNHDVKESGLCWLAYDKELLVDGDDN